MPDFDEELEDILLNRTECGAVADLLRDQPKPQPPAGTPPVPQADSIPQGVPMLRLSVVACILLAGAAHGQGWPPPYRPVGLPQYNPQPFPPPNSAEARRAARDQVLRSVGPEALAFTKRHGDLGITALQQCSPETGKRLVALFNSGDLARLKNQQAALEAIQRNGNPAGAWLCDNIGRLADPEALECWCKAPLEYVYDLKDIDRDAEALRASRKLVPSWLKTDTGEWNMTAIGIGALVLVLLLVAIWKRRQPAPAVP